MVRSPRCAHDRAQPGSAAGNPCRGPPAPAPPPASQKQRGQKKKKKRREKAPGGGAEGGGREPQVPPQKIPRKGEGSPRSSSRPRPPKTIWKLLPTSPGLLTLPSTSRRTKPFLEEARGCPLGRARGSREPLSQRLPPGRLGTAAVMVSPQAAGPPGARGAWPRRALALLRARHVLGWIPVFIFDLFFIL